MEKILYISVCVSIISTVITLEEITEGLRNWIASWGFFKLTYLFNCPFCISFYVCMCFIPHLINIYEYCAIIYVSAIMTYVLKGIRDYVA